MKRIYSLLIVFIITSPVFSQIKYDDGPIITSGNFVTAGTWGRNNITFSFQNGTDDIAGNDEQNAIRQAFQIWADYGNLNFTEVTNNADIVILWGIGNHGDGFPFNGVNGVLAHAFFPPPDGGTFAGDIHFDDDETWTMVERPVPSGQPIDLVTVAAHEIGHALGLGHSDVACALMNAFYTGSHRYLSQDDVDGIQSIYGNRTVVRTTNLDCSGGTFFINNLPNGASVFWTSSNNSIATVANNNNQGIVSRVVNANGSVRITATITLPCGTSVIEFMDIIIGTPIPTIQYVTYYGNDVGLGALIIPNASYNWYEDGVLTEANGGSSYVTTVECNTSKFIQVEAVNSCGTSIKAGRGISVKCSNGGAYSLAPNPATSDLTISSTETTTSSTNDIKEVRIVDKGGIQKLYHKYAAGTKRVNLNVYTLKSDVYFIQIFNGKEWSNQQLIIQH